jgi:hypothetical protein
MSALSKWTTSLTPTTKLILIRWFDFMRKFNANAPGLIEARWAIKRCSHADEINRVLSLRSKGKSLMKIAAHESTSEEHVRQLLLKGAKQARAVSEDGVELSPFNQDKI